MLKTVQIETNGAGNVKVGLVGDLHPTDTVDSACIVAKHLLGMADGKPKNMQEAMFPKKTVKPGSSPDDESNEPAG